MKAVVLTDYKTAALSIENIPIPELQSEQVLVKIAAASINPSDLVFLRDQYGVHKKLPVVPGFEGSGTVVASKAGWYGRWLVGKPVACKAPEDGNGTWAEYMAVDAKSVIPLCKCVTLEQAASLIVNPFTAWALLSIVRDSGQNAFIQTAAGSALGRMMERLSRRWGLISVNIVRRRELVERMKQEGAIHVLDSSQDGWQAQLRVLSERHKIRIAFDSIGGALTESLAASLLNGGRIITYGALAGENCQMPAASLIFEGKRLEGFWLTEWIKTKSLFQKLRMAKQCQLLLPSDLRTKVQARFSLDQIQDALALYKQKRSEGKVLLIPGSRDLTANP